MSTRADVILDDFGKNLNISGMKFDENRLCSFKVDEKYNVTIFANSEDSVFIYGLLGKLGSSLKSEVFALLLSTNLYLAEANMHVLAYEPKNALLLLAKSYSMDGMDAVSIENIIDRLVIQIDSVTENLRSEAGIELYEP